MRIIPAIDLIDGKCVRLEKGDFGKKTIYDSDPLEMAQKFEASGMQYLHLIDLDGAKTGSPQNQSILEKIKSRTALKVDFGGGIRTLESAESAYNAGADQINLGSIAVKDSATVNEMLTRFPSDFIILSPDVVDKMIAIHGWQEKSGIHLFDFIKDYSARGVQYYVCTDIEKDGMLSGSAIGLYEEVLAEFPDIKLVASGGVTTTDEIETLWQLGLNGVIIGKAIYEGRITLENLMPYVS